MSGFVDADAHVVESEATWSFMDAAEARFRPRLVPGIDEASGRATEYWASDGLRVRGGVGERVVPHVVGILPYGSVC